MEFHHLQSVAVGHAHTWPRLADCGGCPPVVGYLLSFSQPSIFLPSHIVESPMGTFFLLPHHLSLLSLLLGETGVTRNRGNVCTGEFRTGSLLMSKPAYISAQSWGRH